MSSKNKVWFITGCSTGFGLSITKYALSRGDKVIATLRKPEVLSELAAKHPDNLLVLKLDVTQPAEVISEAFAAGNAKFGRIDVVVNNAGFGTLSEVESLPESGARDIFEVNFWGASRVSREAVRFFREENTPAGGRLLQMSSMLGVSSLPCMVHYSASKFALEGLSEGLAAELHPDWNIKVTILQPGQFLTNIIARVEFTPPVHPAYTDPSLPTAQTRAVFENPIPLFDGDPDKFAEAVYKVAYLDDPPLRLPIHPKSLVIMRQKGKELLEVADKWESWSENVLIKE